MKKIINNNLYMLKFMWKYCRSNVVARLLSTLTAPVQPFIFIITMKLAVDGIAQGRNLSYLMLIILIGFAVGSVTAIINSWINNRSSAIAQQKISKGLQVDLFKKAQKLDLSCYDDAEFFDKYTRAMQEAERRAVEVLDSVVSIMSSLFALVMIILLLAYLSPMVILISFVILGLNMFLDTRRNKVVFDREMELTRPTREAEYYKKLYYEPQYAQELHMGKLGNLVEKKFDHAMDNVINVVKGYSGKMFFSDSALNVVGFSQMSAIMAYAAWQITSGNLTIGDFAALLNGSAQMLERFVGLFGQIPSLHQNSLFIDNLRTVLDYQPAITNKPNDIDASSLGNNTISIRNVSFTYPKKNYPVLKNITMDIRHGSKTAIVGYNGVGKTTLAKLILRFYDPDSGVICLGNTPYQNISIDSLRNKFGVLFQNHKCYAMTVAENVLFDDEINKENEYRIIESLKYSGIYGKISGFEQGIHTNISREFDTEGVPLSFGEEQKIAIARAFVENRDILIFDEPSSSLDPVAEHDINSKIIELAANKTVIFISHRLSAVRMADMIYMINDGEVIESGTHSELMNLHGKYCEMFNMQAEYYRIE